MPKRDQPGATPMKRCSEESVRVLDENNYPFVVTLRPHPCPSPSGLRCIHISTLTPSVPLSQNWAKGLGDEGLAWIFYWLDYS